MSPFFSTEVFIRSPLVSALLLFAGVLVVWFSRRDLADSHRHDFPRCFAFETLLLEIYLVVPAWFDDPWSVPHIVSWFLLVASLALAIVGFRLLRHEGKPATHFETTTVLVRTGIYRWIRHPLYASLFYLSWGVALKDICVLTVAAASVATAFLVATARVEEIENAAKFGDAYTAYARSTKRFIPFIF